jgi:hypothetical protein
MLWYLCLRISFQISFTIECRSQNNAELSIDASAYPHSSVAVESDEGRVTCYGNNHDNYCSRRNCVCHLQKIYKLISTHISQQLRVSILVRTSEEEAVL